MNNLPPIARDYLQPLLLTLPDVQLAIFLRLIAFIAFHQQLLPLDRNKCLGIAQVRTAAQMEAFDTVIAEHFDMLDQGRCPRHMAELGLDFHAIDENNAGVTRNATQRDHTVIQRLPSSSVTRQEQNKARQQRHRDRRVTLEERARANGFSPLKRHSMAQLRDMANGITPRNADVTLIVTQRDTSVMRDSRVRADLPEYQIQKTEQPLASLAAREGSVTQAGAACLAMRAAGLAQANPSHPELAKLLSAGVTAEELAQAAAEAAERGKGFAYALAVAKGRREDAARSATVAEVRKEDTLAQLAGPALMARIRGVA